MKLLIPFFIFIGLFQTANAQSYIGTKGERVDYDTAIVISVQAYRKEMREAKTKDLLLDSLRHQLQDMKKQTTILAVPQQNALTREELLIELKELKKDMPKHKWYHNPLLYMGVGALLGVYVID